MGIVEQFQQSLFFQWKEIGKWKAQSIWKSFFYLLCLVLLSSLILSFSSFSKTSKLDYEALLTEMEPFVLSEKGLDYTGEPLIVPIPVFDTTVMIGKVTQRATTYYVVTLQGDGFKFGKNGLMSPNITSYSRLPIWGSKQEYTNADVLKLLQENESQLKQVAFFYQYMKAFLQVMISIVFISIIALVSIPFGRGASVSYRRLWMFGAYGMTLPIVIKTILKLTGFFIPYFGMMYWFAVIIFVFLTVNTIKRSA
ncbi:DUF1189 domain-containing protein [Listeria sp. SHR_NRA_18]|uniref:DUF1189 family protein n=1 Tax=Listeria TaxID=1637 RepID=UPI00051DD009|nr:MULTISPECIES: DUF1189 family protein [Listeria]KGL38588.1 hypothetical protein EP56_15600 [Listeriaceae bacterium FSL A5-0209]KMT59076.1 hypothetical protein X559_2864 [Listeria newyorkensis]RQW67919.1 DUF1189 domain-containing protein [Listeria sp. SHR_NRA_18]